MLNWIDPQSLGSHRNGGLNGLPTPTKVEAPLGTNINGSEDKRDWPNSNASVIGMMLYLLSNTKPDISFDVNQYAGLLLTPRYHTRQL